MIEPRIYRAAFLPALFALVLLAFSLEPPPRTLEQGPAADVLFEGTGSINTVRSIVEAEPDRSAGSRGDRATAARVAGSFRRSGFVTQVDRFDDGDRELVNVIGRRAGESTRAVVVLAARDSDEPPDAPGSAADTAALIEFARIFEGRALGRTLVLGSIDGAELGDAGARRFAERMADTNDIEAVIVVSDLGAKRSRGPVVVGWSNGVLRTGLALQRTVTESLREEVERVPDQEGTLAQFARLSFPIAPGGQGVLIDDGFDAVRIAGAGEIADRGGALKDVDVERYGELGRGVLRMVGTLEASKREPERGDESYLTIAGNQLPTLTLQLLAIALILPALVASIDALARARRRREPVSPWVAWLAGGAVPFLAALVLAWLLVLAGVIDDAPPAPPAPSSVDVDGGALAGLIATALVAIAGWVVLRTRLVRREAPLRDAAEPGAGCVVSIGLSAVALAIAFVNPFAALVLVPAVHLWMLAMLTDVQPRGALVLAVLGVLPLVAVALYYMYEFDLGPLRVAYYLLLLVTGNQTGLATTAVGLVLLTLTASVVTIVVTRARAYERPGPRGGDGHRPEAPRQQIFGPGGHAGPGMLGGTTTGGARR